MDLFNVIIYFTFYLFVLVVGYQYIRERTWRRLLGLLAMVSVVVLYTVSKVLFPRSLAIPTFLPPVGVLGGIYYLTYVKRPNRLLAVFIILFLIVLVTAYLISVISPGL